MKKFFNILLLIYLILSLGLFYGVVFRGQKEISEIENRTLQKIPNFSLTAFKSKEFQNQLEDSIADQLLGGQTIKLKINEYKTLFNDSVNEYIKSSDERFCLVYENIKDDIYSFGCSEYLLQSPVDWDRFKGQIDKHIEMFNTMQGVPLYLYYVNDSASIDFTKLEEKDNYYNYLKANLKLADSDYLKFDDFNGYKKYFYETDHHWNYVGSYQGYQDMVRMMFGRTEPLVEPTGTHTFDFIFYGSRAMTCSKFTTEEKFKVYKFAENNITTVVDGKNKAYNSSKSIYNGTFPFDKYARWYAHFYGGQVKLVVYDNPDAAREENLLIIGNSHANANQDLLAHHFRKVYKVDLRYYEGTFDYQDFIEKNNISKTIIIGDIKIFGDYTFVF